MWVNTFANPTMNKAILFAQVALYVALWLPGLNSVLGLYVDEIHGFGWFIAFIGAIACLICCELYKFIAGKWVQLEALSGYEEDEDGSVKNSDVVVTVDK